MKQYKYIVFDQKKNTRKEGTMEALNSDQAVNALQSDGFMVLHIAEYTGLSFGNISQISLTGISLKEKVVFIRQLSTMITAGLPLAQCLYILEEQSKGKLAEVIASLVKTVEGGQSFADALAMQKGFFSTMQVALVRAGEKSGKFSAILSDMADNMESALAIRSKIRGAMIYPVVIMLTAIAVVIVVLITLIPTITGLYESYGSTKSLPFETETLVVLSNIILTKYIFLLILVIAIVAGFMYFKSTEGGKRFIAKLVLTIPLVRTIVISSNIVSFCKTLSLLTSAGVPILESLEMTAHSLSNSIYEQAVLSCKAKVEKGIPLSFTVEETGIFPPMLSKMISIGESTGKMDEMLLRTGTYFNNELNNLVGNLTKLMEPITLLVMGGIVAYIAIAIYAPIYSLGSVIQ